MAVTGYELRLHEVYLPSAVRSLERIADSLEVLAENNGKMTMKAAKKITARKRAPKPKKGN